MKHILAAGAAPLAAVSAAAVAQNYPARPIRLIVHPSLPVKNVKELVALARAKPGRLSYASGGLGSAIRLAMELFQSAAGIDALHIPYKGAAPALTDVLGQRRGR